MQKSEALLSAPWGGSAPGSAHGGPPAPNRGVRERLYAGAGCLRILNGAASGSTTEQAVRPIEGRLCVRERMASAR
jgi:hypothetical protein